MLKALQIVGLLTLRPDREIVCVVNPRVSLWRALDGLRAPNARDNLPVWLWRLWACPEGTTTGQSEGLELGQQIGAHAFTSRRMLEARAAAYSLASLQAKSKV